MTPETLRFYGGPLHLMQGVAVLCAPPPAPPATRSEPKQKLISRADQSLRVCRGNQHLVCRGNQHLPFFDMVDVWWLVVLLLRKSIQ